VHFGQSDLLGKDYDDFKDRDQVRELETSAVYFNIASVQVLGRYLLLERRLFRHFELLPFEEHQSYGKRVHFPV
jgi:hypothetical protein